MRAVRLSASFERLARELYPPGGSGEGAPSYELFAESVLAAAKLEFAIGWDLGDAALGDDRRAVMTGSTPVFPPMVFYGRLLEDDSIEIVGFDVDQGFWDLIGGDPNG
jgi:hypothetical protein